MLSNMASMSIAVRAAVGFLALVGIVQLIVLPTLVESFRQHIFETRRELFRFMMTGAVSPTEPAYILLRHSMDGLLRFAQRVTMSRAIMHAVLTSGNSAMIHKMRVDNAMGNVKSEEAKKRLMHFRRKIDAEIIKHLLRTSPIAWIFVVMVIVPIVLRALVKVRADIAKSGRRLAVTALRQRMLVEGIQADIESLEGVEPLGDSAAAA